MTLNNYFDHERIRTKTLLVSQVDYLGGYWSSYVVLYLMRCSTICKCTSFQLYVGLLVT